MEQWNAFMFHWSGFQQEADYDAPIIDKKGIKGCFKPTEYKINLHRKSQPVLLPEHLTNIEEEVEVAS